MNEFKLTQLLILKFISNAIITMYYGYLLIGLDQKKYNTGQVFSKVDIKIRDSGRPEAKY